MLTGYLFSADTACCAAPRRNPLYLLPDLVQLANLRFTLPHATLFYLTRFYYLLFHSPPHATAPAPASSTERVTDDLCNARTGGRLRREMPLLATRISDMVGYHLGRASGSLISIPPRRLLADRGDTDECVLLRGNGCSTNRVRGWRHFRFARFCQHDRRSAHSSASVVFFLRLWFA